MPGSQLACAALFVAALALFAQETHDHPAPEKLGNVSFPITCIAPVQAPFNRGIALLHSFAYSAARDAFLGVAKADPACAIAHWGAAMTWYHQLWDPPFPGDTVANAQSEIEAAQRIGGGSPRERDFIAAFAAVVENAATTPYSARAPRYEQAMENLAAANPNDVESQVFFALALVSNAPPSDKSHARQKRAIAIIEPLDRKFPDHPGIPHYLIHACDNAELAARGLPAARAYAQIAPSAPHALHMPSHIFTRLGLWDDSIASNLAARDAARHAGDSGEELHAMDYLVYAYLQQGRDSEARQVVAELERLPAESLRDFKGAYAYTAMQARYAVERGQWDDAIKIASPPGAPPHVAAIAAWSRGLGFARTGRLREAESEIARLHQLESELRAAGNSYWAEQTAILASEVQAWSADASGKPDDAETAIRAAAEAEDAVEKLPVTPGPILPAREQLGFLLLAHHQPQRAAAEFDTALANSPGRRASLQGKARALHLAASK